MDRNHYSILGLPTNATARQIRDRFLELARERHPDRFRGEEKREAEEAFQEITLAFNTLSDPERRRRFDAELAQGRGAGQPSREEGAARAYLRRGVKAYRAENWLEAAENFDRATREDPKNARAWHYLALAARHRKRWMVRARNAIVKACELEPMNPGYLELAGRLFHESGLSSKAEEYLRKAVEWGAGESAEKLLAEVRSGGRRGAGVFGRGG